MRTSILSLLVILFYIGCGQGADVPEVEGPAQEKPLLTVQAPDPLPFPEYITPSSDEDWKAKVNNKDIEVIQLINIINPVAAFITEGFKQYGTRFSEGLQEEWKDTQVQLTKALTLYESCKTRKAENKFDKKLFLDHEETWQLLVKTGVAGLRTKTMIEAEIKKMIGI